MIYSGGIEPSVSSILFYRWAVWGSSYCERGDSQGAVRLAGSTLDLDSLTDLQQDHPQVTQSTVSY